MSIFEVRSTLTYRSLMNKSKADLAHMILDLCDVNAKLHSDSELMDWWEQHLNYQHGTDYETGEVEMYEVVGNINDREWHKRAAGETLRDALRAAIRALKDKA